MRYLPCSSGEDENDDDDEDGDDDDDGDDDIEEGVDILVCG